MIVNRNSLRDFGRVHEIDPATGVSQLWFGGIAARGAHGLVPISTDALVVAKGAEINDRDCFWAEVTISSGQPNTQPTGIAYMQPEATK